MSGVKDQNSYLPLYLITLILLLLRIVPFYSRMSFICQGEIGEPGQKGSKGDKGEQVSFFFSAHFIFLCLHVVVININANSTT